MRCAKKLGECTRVAEVSTLPFDGRALLAGLIAAVDSASYWAEPDGEDRGFASEAVREALWPVAEAVATAARAAGVCWWSSPTDRDQQRYVQFLGRHPLPVPLLAGAAESVGAWLADTLGDSGSSDDLLGDADAPYGGRYGGRWWSSPVTSRLPVTTRALPGLGAVRLVLGEGLLGWQSARCWPVVAENDIRVYEVSGPDQWAELVGRYRLDVTKSRSDDWGRATGWTGRCLIPDYAAVAVDWDAVHVPAVGYLAASGIAIPVGDGACTMLAGWDPDATWWLTDVLSSAADQPEDWRSDDQAPFSWTQPPQP